VSSLLDLFPEEWPRFALMGVLLAGSALFSAAETAFFSLSREEVRRLRADGSVLSAFVVNLRGDARKLLVSVLLGNLAVSVGYFSIGGVLAAHLERDAGGTAAVVFSVLLLVVYIFVGEFVPKGAAMAKPVALARAAAVPIYVFEKIVLPLRAVLERIAAAISRLTRVRSSKEPYVSAEELKACVRLAGAAGGIADDEREMVEDVIEMGRTHVKEVLVPRVDMVSIGIDADREEVLALARSERVSKIVVVGESRDDVKGWVAVKDLLYRPHARLPELVRDISAVPETKTVESLLREFRKTGAALALVVDEYGGTEGIVTPEDVIEEIVGEIADEYDPEEGVVRRIAPGVTILPGDLPVREWEERSGIGLPKGRYDTVGGYVMEALERVPRPGDAVRQEGVRFTVLRVRRGRVLSLLADGLAGEER
jgi:CBS domain containing-hemolysin-like protein